MEERQFIKCPAAVTVPSRLANVPVLFKFSAMRLVKPTRNMCHSLCVSAALIGLLLFHPSTALSSGTVISWDTILFPNVPAGTVFTNVDCAWNHTVAIKSDGTVAALSLIHI